MAYLPSGWSPLDQPWNTSRESRVLRSATVEQMAERDTSRKAKALALEGLSVGRRGELTRRRRGSRAGWNSISLSVSQEGNAGARLLYAKLGYIDAGAESVGVCGQIMLRGRPLAVAVGRREAYGDAIAPATRLPVGVVRRSHRSDL
jgi:hypothetical protein